MYFAGNGIEEGLGENMKIHAMILETCKRLSHSRVLIDDRQVEYTSSILSLYDLAGHYKTTGAFSELDKVAVVANVQYHKDNVFYENVTRNRGINLRVFYDFDEAVAWLKNDE
ncbi:MAG: hypothetical protein HS100_19900 [Anaerolineales bacterium]|nr:hypothetical protein [Anaerolineales bacterium]